MHIVRDPRTIALGPFAVACTSMGNALHFVLLAVFTVVTELLHQTLRTVRVLRVLALIFRRDR